MLMVICVKFNRTPASLKTNLTKNFNLNGMDEQTDERTNIPENYMPLILHMLGHDFTPTLSPK